MADVQTTTLYEQDFYLWALDQARAVRALRDAAAGQGDLTAALNGIDWDDLIEELEGLAKRDRRELHSRLMTIVEHLTKLAVSSAKEPRSGWENTIRRERREIEILLQQSPSLRREVAELLDSPQVAKTVTETLRAIQIRMEMGATVDGLPGRPFTPDQALNDWWPEQAGNDS